MQNGRTCVARPGARRPPRPETRPSQIAAPTRRDHSV